MQNVKKIKGRLAVLFAATLMLIASVSSCKRCNDPCNMDCRNYDPCCGQAPANASFKIYEILQRNPSIKYNGFEPEDVATDTIVFINTARFYADYEADYYEWRIDGDNRVWNTREFFLSFMNLPYYQPAEVTLKVYKQFDKSCFPNGHDTAVFKRTLYTVSFDSSEVYNKYVGYRKSNPNQSTEFEIFMWRDLFGSKEDSIKGIFPYCSDGTNFGLNNSAIGYKSFYVSNQSRGSGCCYGLSAFGRLTTHDELKMTFGYFNAIDSCEWTILNNEPYLKDVFYGIKQK